MVKGRSVVQAYELELLQNWSGIACIPAEYISPHYRDFYYHILQSAMTNWNRRLVSEYNIPVNSGMLKLHALSWHPNCVNTAYKKATDIVEELMEQREGINDPEILLKLDKKISKYPATLRFMELCKNDFREGD